MTHFVKLLMLIVWIGCVQSTISASAQPPPSEYLDLMSVENLTFYRYEWTTGGPKRLQLECFSYDGDKCPEFLTAVLCTNNDYRKFDKVNATRLNWTCNLIFNPDKSSDSLYYIGENDSEVHCEEVSRTTTERYVIRGSCSVKFTWSYKWFLAILFFIGLSLALTLVCYLIFYFIIAVIRKGFNRNSYNKM